MAKFGTWVGLDMHKEKIDVAAAYAPAGREQARNWGEIANRPEPLRPGYETGPATG